MEALPASLVPDYDRIGADFDRWLPFVQPVTLAILELLPILPEGSLVLDLACGTGEPGLTLARRSPEIRLLGVDAAPGMLTAARFKAAAENLTNARFEVMASETLGVGDASVRAVISRFGALMFGDPRASAREMARVLAAGGAFCLAVWDDMSKNRLVNAVFDALRPILPESMVPSLARLNEMAGEERRASWLREAGMTDVRTEMFGWNVAFPSLRAWWELVSGPGVFERQFAVLGEADKERARLHAATLLADYRDADGTYTIPHECRLLWGKR